MPRFWPFYPRGDQRQGFSCPNSSLLSVTKCGNQFWCVFFLLLNCICQCHFSWHAIQMPIIFFFFFCCCCCCFLSAHMWIRIVSHHIVKIFIVKPKHQRQQQQQLCYAKQFELFRFIRRSLEEKKCFWYKFHVFDISRGAKKMCSELWTLVWNGNGIAYEIVTM